MQDSLGDGRPLPQRGQGFALERYAGAFEPRSDLSYRLIERMDVAGCSVNLSGFSGSILRDCSFVDVDFSRSDLDGTRIENCHFRNCDLSRIDLRSSTVSNSEFLDCSLEGADLLDSTFINVLFRKAAFTRTSTHGTHFERCAFVRCSLSGASWTLCTLRQSTFEQMLLGDCTFMYNVMKDCTFTDSSAEVDAIGMVYGLTPANLVHLRFLFQDEEQPVPEGADVVALLAELYEQRRWGLGVMVMRLNFGLTSRVYAIREYFRWLSDALASGMVVRTEEIDFLGMMFRDLRAAKTLPLLNVIDCIDVLNGPVAASIAHLRETRTYAMIGNLTGSLQALLVEMLDEFERERIVLPRRAREDQPLVVKAIFEEKPASSLAELLGAAGIASSLPIGYPSVTLETSTGSFIEIVKTSVYSVLALQIVLFLLNGCAIQAMELKERVRHLLSSKTPTEFRRLALQPRQRMPVRVAASFQALADYVSRLPWFGRADLGGFSPENFRELQRIRVPSRPGPGDWP
jgi:uncharacterized protein YjbI with pentapeptide repeats